MTDTSNVCFSIAAKTAALPSTALASESTMVSFLNIFITCYFKANRQDAVAWLSLHFQFFTDLTFDQSETVFTTRLLFELERATGKYVMLGGRLAVLLAFH